jgi:hypothetical protein
MVSTNDARRRWQFSLRHMLLITIAVAILFAVLQLGGFFDPAEPVDPFHGSVDLSPPVGYCPEIESEAGVVQDSE